MICFGESHEHTQQQPTESIVWVYDMDWYMFGRWCGLWSNCGLRFGFLRTYMTAPDSLGLLCLLGERTSLADKWQNNVNTQTSLVDASGCVCYLPGRRSVSSIIYYYYYYYYVLAYVSPASATPDIGSMDIIYMYIHTHTYILYDVYIYIYIYIYDIAVVYIYIYIYMCIYIYIYIMCIYIYMHIYIYIHILCISHWSIGVLRPFVSDNVIHVLRISCICT